MAHPVRPGGWAVLARVLAGAVLLGAVFLPSPARAEGCAPGWAPSSIPGAGVICIPASEPGEPADSGTTVPVATGGSEDPGCRRATGAAVECVSTWGVWTPKHQCWAHPASVPPNHPAWGGHTDGEVWMCALIVDSASTVTFWVPDGGPVAAPPDPGELAESALGQLQLATAEVRIAPDYPDPAVVGIENWLWLPESQWQSLSKTVRAGGTAVTVTAKPERVVWDMATGGTTCFDAGRPWTKGMGDEAVTRCGYTYEQTSSAEPDGVFRVAATIGYDVDWTCSGVCTTGAGSLGLVDAPAGAGAVRVVQRQTVVVR